MLKISAPLFLLFSISIYSVDITQLPENYRKIILPLLAALPKTGEAKNKIIAELEECSECMKSESKECHILKIYRLYQKYITLYQILFN